MGRVVMFNPPKHGRKIVDKLGDFDAFGWFNGPAGMQTGTGSDSLHNRLPLADCKLGIIAGNEFLNPFFSAMLEGPDDGKVSVASTNLKGMKAYMTLPVTHTFMTNNFRVIGEAVLFLEKDAFDPDIDWGDIVSIAIQELADNYETR